MQKHIIACLSYKINPFFQFFANLFPGPSKQAPEGAGAVKPFFRGFPTGLCQFFDGRKNRKFVEFWQKILCKLIGAHFFPPPVENHCGKPCGECGKLIVFNRYSGCGGFCTGGGKTAETFRNSSRGGALRLCYVTGFRKALPEKIPRNCCQPGQK